ncbi:MAG: hypothetical protein J6D21_01945 [Clostridia bacterium]|nr:hypothetical protein [Clostridia bacterium]
MPRGESRGGVQSPTTGTKKNGIRMDAVLFAVGWDKEATRSKARKKRNFAEAGERLAPRRKPRRGSESHHHHRPAVSEPKSRSDTLRQSAFPDRDVAHRILKNGIPSNFMGFTTEIGISDALGLAAPREMIRFIFYILIDQFF